MHPLITQNFLCVKIPRKTPFRQLLINKAIFYCKNTLKKDESSLTNPSLSFNNCITLSSSDPFIF